MGLYLITRIHLFGIILYSSTSIASQNADMNLNPEAALLGGSITLTCRYTGAGIETAIFWFNGSSPYALILTPALDIPKCEEFSTGKDFHFPRIVTTCDAESNTYTLNIDPVFTVDANVEWSCTFSDPGPNHERAKITIPVEATSTDSGVGSKTFEISLVIVIVACTITFIVIIIIIRFRRELAKRRSLAMLNEKVQTSKETMKPMLKTETNSGTAI